MAFDEGVYVHYVGSVGSDPTDTDREGSPLMTKSGKAITKFRFAVNAGPKKDDGTNWYDVPVLDSEYHPNIRQAVKNAIRKGTRLAIIGEETQKTVGDKSYLTLWPRQIYLIQHVEEAGQQASEEF